MKLNKILLGKYRASKKKIRQIYNSYISGCISVTKINYTFLGPSLNKSSANSNITNPNTKMPNTNSLVATSRSNSNESSANSSMPRSNSNTSKPNTNTAISISCHSSNKSLFSYWHSVCLSYNWYMTILKFVHPVEFFVHNVSKAAAKKSMRF